MFIRAWSIIVALFAMSCSTTSYADGCLGRGGADVCGLATVIANKTNSTLPSRLSEDLIWVSSSAHGPVYQSVFQLTYNEDHIETLSRQGGGTVADFKAGVTKMCIQTACHNSTLRYFMSLGGIPQVVYKYRNGDIIADIMVKDTMCTS